MPNQEEYSEQLYTEDELLLEVKKAIAGNHMPEVSIAPGYGRLLTMLVSLSRSRNILEIGALGGYSGICLCRGLADGGSLTSLELKAEYAGLAGRHLQQAGFGDTVEYKIGPALDSLKLLEAEGRTLISFSLMRTRRITRIISNMRSDWPRRVQSSPGIISSCAAAP